MDLCTDICEEISSGAEMYRLMGKCGNITEVFEETFKTGNQKGRRNILLLQSVIGYQL